MTSKLISVKEELKTELDTLKLIPTESYGSVITRLILSKTDNFKEPAEDIKKDEENIINYEQTAKDRSIQDIPPTNTPRPNFEFPKTTHKKQEWNIKQ